MPSPKMSIASLAVLATLPTSAVAQDPPDESSALRMFLDCTDFFCDLDFYRREISFVDYVRDRRDADVHVLITTQASGGGREYALSFIGLGNFDGVTTNLRHASSSTDTQDEIRQGLARVIKFGLMQFVAGTPLAEQIDIVFRPPGGGRPTAAQSQDDPWNFWVFRIRSNGSMNGESSSQSYRINGSVNANRTTESWKINLSVNGNYNRSEFELTDSTTFVNTTESYGGSGLLVRSLTDHWSLGGRTSVNRSTFLNQDLRVRAGPAIEWNLFPYSESSRRQFTFRYEIGINAMDYEEETIFDKTSETLFEESLTATLDVTQPWGSSSLSLTGSHFFHDFSKNRINLFGNANFRLVRGLSFNMFGSITRVRDQLFLAKGGASDEEILLRRRQLETSYTYFVSGGFSYQFGSIFNNVVNPRFGGGEQFFFF